MVRGGRGEPAVSPRSGRRESMRCTVMADGAAAVTTARRLILAPVRRARFAPRRVVPRKCLLSSLAGKAGGGSFFYGLAGRGCHLENKSMAGKGRLL